MRPVSKFLGVHSRITEPNIYREISKSVETEYLVTVTVIRGVLGDHENIIFTIEDQIYEQYKTVSK